MVSRFFATGRKPSDINFYRTVKLDWLYFFHFLSYFTKRPSLIGPCLVIDNHSLVSFPSSVTRLGDFRKIFLIKVAQIFGNFLGFFEVCHYIIKKLLWFLLGPVKQNWVKFLSQHLVTLFPSFFSCQSFKCSKIIIYDSGVVLTRKLPTVWLYSRNLRS